MVDIDQQYRFLTFLAGFGAVGALGCDWLMNEEKDFPELSQEQKEELPEVTNEHEKHPEETTD